jgi:selenophosphate synthetase-related protein
MEERPEEKEDYLTEYFNLAFILRGHVKELEAVKEYIVTEYVRKNTLRMIKPVYDKRRLYIMTEEQWEEYQDLKKARSNL